MFDSETVANNGNHFGNNLESNYFLKIIIDWKINVYFVWKVIEIKRGQNSYFRAVPGLIE